MNNKPCTITNSTDPIASYEAAINERPDNVAPNSSKRPKRSVGSHTKYWEPGRTLKIALYDEDQETIERVKTAASKWLPYINLKFNFVSGEEGDIRIYINYAGDGGGKSAVGTDALIISPAYPTMTVDAAPETPRFEFIVLHEFGHALGLDHEHQHPDASIPWDLPKTYALHQQQFGWSRELVDLNVLPLPRVTDKTYGSYDCHSVMHYEISSECTIGGWEQNENWELSAKDIEAIRKAYP
ncbi:matrixin family metalloprotease [Pseudomonas sp. NPDC087697]|uniref:matrixin family metalloprotease n=1 Tax=Pseudomonas sp. NPDC087697 TaxID=3364447 RepID=UPI00381C2F44